MTDYIIEPRHGGRRVQIHRRDNDVFVYAPDGSEIPISRKVENNIRYSHVIDFVADAFMHNDDGEVAFILHDIISHGSSDQRQESLTRRKKTLDAFKKNDTIRSNEYVTSTRDNLENSIRICSHSSPGVIIRDSDSKYVSGESRSYVEYKALSHGVPLPSEVLVKLMACTNAWAPLSSVIVDNRNYASIQGIGTFKHVGEKGAGGEGEVHTLTYDASEVPKQRETGALRVHNINAHRAIIQFRPDFQNEGFLSGADGYWELSYDGNAFQFSKVSAEDARSYQQEWINELSHSSIMPAEKIQKLFSLFIAHGGIYYGSEVARDCGVCRDSVHRYERRMGITYNLVAELYPSD